MAPATCVHYSKRMCNELHYNAFRNNAVNIRQVREIPPLQKMCSKNKRTLNSQKSRG